MCVVTGTRHVMSNNTQGTALTGMLGLPLASSCHNTHHSVDTLHNPHMHSVSREIKIQCVNEITLARLKALKG